MVTMMRFRFFLLTCAAVLLGACASTIQTTANGPVLDADAKWALLPLTNHTDTPQAALSAESMLDHLLRLRGVQNLQIYPAALSRDSLFEPSERKVSEEALEWARTQGIRYAVSGSVEEWRYKVGLDGEPAVGVTLRVVDLGTGKTVWSASGAKSGWSRQALSAVAQKVLGDLAASMSLPGSSTRR